MSEPRHYCRPLLMTGLALTMIAIPVLLTGRLGPRHAGANILASAAPWGQSECGAEGSQVASPATVHVGDAVQVQLAFHLDCPYSPLPTHYMLVMDGSLLAGGQTREDMKVAARQLIDALELANQPLTQVGVVQFASHGEVLCELTNDAGRAKSCVSRLGATGAPAIETGITTGLEALARGREVFEDAPREVMIVFANAANAYCEPVLQAANTAKGQKVLMVAVCSGADCYAACLRQVASSNRYYFPLDDADALVASMVGVQRPQVRPQTLTITETLPVGMVYVPGSAVPAARETGQSLAWTLNHVPASGMTIQYQVQPTTAGPDQPVSAGAVVDWLDDRGDTGRLQFPVARVSVTAIEPTPTSTPRPAGGILFLPLLAVR